MPPLVLGGFAAAAVSAKLLGLDQERILDAFGIAFNRTGGSLEIILDPKQAFGTGHHATTRMLLEWLEDRIQGGEAVLDVGAGSGILAMVALRLGARSAIGVELDPVAVACARDYAVENHFGPELTWVCGTLRDVPHPVTPDLVLANLDRQTLLLLAEELAVYGAKGGEPAILPSILTTGVVVKALDAAAAS